MATPIKPIKEKETSAAAKSAQPMRETSVRGGSTSRIMMSLAASAALKASTVAQKAADIQPLMAKSMLIQQSFASLRDAVNNLELRSNALSIQIDQDKSRLEKNKVSDMLERDFAPFRSEAADLYASYRSLKDRLNTFHPQFMASLAEIQKDIANGKTQPSHIDPQFSGLSRTVNDMKKELEKLKLNDAHLVGKMQLVAKQVDFHVTAVRSQLSERGLSQKSPQRDG